MARCFGQGADSSGAVLSNLDVFRTLAERIGERTAQQIGEVERRQIVVQVFPKEYSWYLEGSFLRGIASRGFQPVASGDARLEAGFGLINLRVEYANPRREGLFGSKVVDRKVTFAASTKIVDKVAGTVVWDDQMEEGYHDTVHMSELGAIESETLPFTKGVLPTEGFFSSVAEPLVALGAIAVAVLLLFRIRS